MLQRRWEKKRLQSGWEKGGEKLQVLFLNQRGAVSSFQKILPHKDAGGRIKWLDGLNYRIFENLNPYLKEILKHVLFFFLFRF